MNCVILLKEMEFSITHERVEVFLTSFHRIFHRKVWIYLRNSPMSWTQCSLGASRFFFDVVRPLKVSTVTHLTFHPHHQLMKRLCLTERGSDGDNAHLMWRLFMSPSCFFPRKINKSFQGHRISIAPYTFHSFRPSYNVSLQRKLAFFSYSLSTFMQVMQSLFDCMGWRLYVDNLFNADGVHEIAYQKNIYLLYWHQFSFSGRFMSQSKSSKNWTLSLWLRLKFSQALDWTFT